MAHAKFDGKKFKKFTRSVGSKKLNPVYLGWGRKYLTWTKRLFKKNSLGGGEWKQLKSVSYRRATGSSLISTKTGKKRTTRGRAKIKAQFKSCAYCNPISTILHKTWSDNLLL